MSPGPQPAGDIPAMANWLHARKGIIRQHHRAADLKRDLRHRLDTAEATVDLKPPRLYAGPCPGCRADLLGEVGASVITCKCGAVSEVSERRYVMGEALWDTLGTVQWIVTAASALGVRLSEHTVRTWIKRQRLTKRGDRPSALGGMPQSVYRFGDAMKLAAERPERHQQPVVAP
jgi:hypothetical protein